MSGRSPPFPDRGSSMDFLDVVIVALGWIPKEVLRIATYIRAFNQADYEVEILKRLAVHGRDEVRVEHSPG
jgi:hypothetical protein